MKSIFLLVVVVSMFIGCGSSSKSKDDKKVQTNHIHELASTDKKETLAEKDSKTLTIYVHGYDPKGYKRVGVFGNDNYDKVIDKMVEFTEFDTTKTYDNKSKNIIAITPYYGNQAPSYYTQDDKDELNAVGEGIPRYALIIAKFAKEMIKETNSTSLNIVSASMGSLVTRYLIEKDLEHIKSDKLIKKWLSLEGVIVGNIGASNAFLYSIADKIEKQPFEVSQMKYSWIEDQFGDSLENLKDIDIAFESSTDDDLNKKVISSFTQEANDGVQAVKDTYIDGYAHTYFHETHTSLEKRDSAWAYASTFLTSSKRVKITLLEATLEDLHEDKLAFKSILPAEVVFQSRVYSPKAMSKWGFSGAIDERLVNGYYLPIQKYKKEGEAKVVNQTLFDSVVLDDESELRLDVTPYELDREFMYGVREITGHGSKESLEDATVTLPLEDGIYDIRSNEWSGRVKVEVL
jgi:hypothetical protein